MRRVSIHLSILVVILVVGVQTPAKAQDILVPAGSLLRCTLNEPNLSSATAQVGDPVLCQLSPVQEFGRTAFPRGSYMSGHLEADKEPGHFVGKGYLKLVFDRIGLPNGDVPVDTKVIQARGFKVDREGDIDGKGHATRDVVEWMIPPLWPWKVLTLPARGPRPTLKGEELLTLRLMQDIAIPRLAASGPSRDWRPPKPQASFAPRAYNAPRAANVSWAEPIATREPALEVRNISQEATPVMTPAVANISQVTAPVIAIAVQGATKERLTLIALKTEIIYAATAYWVNGEHLSYVLPSGTTGEVALSELDLARTTQLNFERGVTLTLRDRRQEQ